MKPIDLQYYRRLFAGAWRLVWPVLRQVFGWIFILIGLVGLVVPVLQGALFLVIGIALVGRRNWLIRRSTILIKRFLRRWAAVRTPLIGAAGRMALRAQWQFSRQSRRLHRRMADWWEQRRRRRSGELTDESPDSRYERTPDRV